MKREDRAKVYADRIKCDCICVKDAKWVVKHAYLAGAQDAEAHPAWRMCEEELPKSGTQCWCATSDGKEIIARFNGAYWRHSGTSKKDIIAWLPLPKFNPKVE